MTIFEIKKTITNSQLAENLEVIQKIMNELVLYAELLGKINGDDFNYLEIIIEKTRSNLEKAFCLFKINYKENVEKII